MVYDKDAKLIDSNWIDAGPKSRVLKVLNRTMSKSFHLLLVPHTHHPASQVGKEGSEHSISSVVSSGIDRTPVSTVYTGGEYDDVSATATSSPHPSTWV